MDGMLVHGERDMNGKRLLILAAFAAIATMIAPAVYAAGTISNQSNITVKWNTQAIGSLILATNYSATGAQGLAAPTIYTNANSGGGSCTANGVGSEAAGTVNFGNVSSDVAKYTDCQYKNAAIATITTSDPNGYVLGVASVSGWPASGYQLCALPNGTWANNMAVTQSTASAATSIVSDTCPASPDFAIGGTGTASAFTSAAATAGTNLGADYNLVINNAAPIANNSVIVQYTLTLQ
jgi:hypothetical protein